MTKSLVVIECCTTEDSTILTLWDSEKKSRIVIASSGPIETLIPIGAEVQLKHIGRKAGPKSDYRNSGAVGESIEIVKFGNDQFSVKHLAS